MTCPDIFGPRRIRDDGLSKQMGSDKEVEICERADRSDFARSGQGFRS